MNPQWRRECLKCSSVTHHMNPPSPTCHDCMSTHTVIKPITNAPPAKQYGVCDKCGADWGPVQFFCESCGDASSEEVSRNYYEQIVAPNMPTVATADLDKPAPKKTERIERVKGWKKPERLRSGDEPRTVVRHDPQERIRQLEEELAAANADRERLALYEDYLVRIGKLGFTLDTLEKLANSWFKGRIQRRRESAHVITDPPTDPDEWYYDLSPVDQAAIGSALDLEINRLAREDKSPLEDPSYGFDALMQRYKGATADVRRAIKGAVERNAVSGEFANKVLDYVDKEEEYRKAGRDLTMVSKAPSKRYAQLLNNERSRMTGRLGGSLAEDICLTIPQEDGQPSYPKHTNDMPGYYMQAHSQVRNFTRFGLKPKEEKHLHRLLDAEEDALKARAANARAIGPATVVMHTGTGRMVGTLEPSKSREKVIDPAETVVRDFVLHHYDETITDQTHDRLVKMYENTWGRQPN